MRGEGRVDLYRMIAIVKHNCNEPPTKHPQNVNNKKPNFLCTKTLFLIYKVCVTEIVLELNLKVIVFRNLSSGTQIYAF